MVALLTDERLRHVLARLANWRRMSSKGDMVPAHPPTSQIRSLLATPDPALPVLAGIVTTPVFGRAGVLLTEPGYHADARLLYQPVPGFQLPAIPEQPTSEDIAAARQLILDDLLGEFPFTSLAERAHAVSLLLLGFLRAMVDGPTPLHLIEKPTAGTGATLMVDAMATILTGSGAGVMTEGTDEEEWRKRITAKLRQIPTLVLIDNLKRQLEASALAAALTAPFWEDRILGVSEITRLPIRCLWIATGNNPTFSNELAAAWCASGSMRGLIGRGSAVGSVIPISCCGSAPIVPVSSPPASPSVAPGSPPAGRAAAATSAATRPGPRPWAAYLRSPVSRASSVTSRR